MIILDTDHLSLLQHPDSPEAAVLMRRIDKSIDPEIVATVVSVEEQLRSWLALLNRYRQMRQQAEYYERLIQFIRFYQDWRILGFDEACGVELQSLRKAGVRIGAGDLKIAATAIRWNATLLTRNTVDFARVPGLKFEDWTRGSGSPNS